MIPQEPGTTDFRAAIESGIESNALTMERLDESVRRVLTLKETLGMMDETLTMDDDNIDRVGSKQDREEALEMARQSIILAENKNNVLPLNPKPKLKVHVTGPTANSLRYQSGGWTWEWQGPQTEEDVFTYGTTVLNAAKILPSWDVSYSCGIDILGAECTDDLGGAGSGGIVSKFANWVGGHGGETPSILQSASMASDADYVIICVGEENYAEKPGDIRSLDLPQGQVELVKALSETNAKTVLVYFGGRPRLLREMVVSILEYLLSFLFQFRDPLTCWALCDIDRML